MKLLRLTIRALMVLVALAAIMGWAIHAQSLEQRRDQYRLQATCNATLGREYAKIAATYRSQAASDQSSLSQSETELAANPGQPAIKASVRAAKAKLDLARFAERSFQESADYYARLVEKYERAASQPWLPVTPDPPMP